MPLGLDNKCLHRLKEQLPKAIKMMHVTHDKYLSDESSFELLFTIDNILPQQGKIHDALEKYIGPYPLITFCSDRISVNLDERFEYRRDNDERPLTTYDGFNDPKVASNSLIDEFESLPYKYRIILELPEDISLAFRILTDAYKISDGIELHSSGVTLSANFPRKTGNGARDRRINRKFEGLLTGLFKGNEDWKAENSYLILEVEGYINRYGTTQPANIARNIVKSFFGLFLAFGLVETKFKLPFASNSVEFFFHKLEPDGWKLDGSYSSDDPFSRTLRELKLIELKPEYNNDKYKRGIVLYFLKQIQPLFENRGDTERIMLASQWFFDSYAHRDEVLNFIQTVIVLEILLGGRSEGDEVGLGVLLKNRAAYFIAELPSDRESIMRSISEIYKLRSKVVHTGKHLISPKERLLYMELRSICKKILLRELKMFASDPSKR